ncbi:DNA-processing protein DprA [Hornefia butyriciproducens]|uniref:DNA-processing protein DprA n=1 Tax=Hornefia butyriciproducens TaxID=2652293 RepID=UPI003D048466
MDRVTVLRKGDPEIPRRLTEIRDTPEILYCDGDVSLLRSRCVAIVGSRKCTQYGISVARAIARRCAECGLTVVSGMALGIDAAAHQGALEAGGRTIAVFACGPDVCYPRENRRIMKEIRDRGLIFSEYPPGEKPAPYKFPMRNRIISGISEAVVVVEASYRSGALITAEFAEEQGRQLYAVPGNITSPASFGSNQIIAEGVMPLLVIEELIRGLGIVPENSSEIREILGEDEKNIFDQIRKHSELTSDELCRLTLLPPQKINGIITVLEMKGLVVSSMGRVFVNRM